MATRKRNSAKGKQMKHSSKQNTVSTRRSPLASAPLRGSKQAKEEGMKTFLIVGLSIALIVILSLILFYQDDSLAGQAISLDSSDVITCTDGDLCLAYLDGGSYTTFDNLYVAPGDTFTVSVLGYSSSDVYSSNLYLTYSEFLTLDTVSSSLAWEWEDDTISESAGSAGELFYSAFTVDGISPTDGIFELVELTFTVIDDGSLIGGEELSIVFIEDDPTLYGMFAFDTSNLIAEFYGTDLTILIDSPNTLPYIDPSTSFDDFEIIDLDDPFSHTFIAYDDDGDVLTINLIESGLVTGTGISSFDPTLHTSSDVSVAGEAQLYFDWTPISSDEGPHEFTLSVSDDGGATSVSEVFTIDFIGGGGEFSCGDSTCQSDQVCVYDSFCGLDSDFDGTADIEDSCLYDANNDCGIMLHYNFDDSVEITDGEISDLSENEYTSFVGSGVSSYDEGFHEWAFAELGITDYNTDDLYAVAFDGSSYTRSEDGTIDSSTGDLSIEVYVRPDNLASDNNAVVFGNYDSSGTSSYKLLTDDSDGDGLYQFKFVVKDENGDLHAIGGSETLTEGEWYRMRMYYVASTNIMQMYSGDTLIGESSDSLAAVVSFADAGGNLILGSNFEQSLPFTGVIDDLRIHDQFIMPCSPGLHAYLTCPVDLYECGIGSNDLICAEVVTAALQENDDTLCSDGVDNDEDTLVDCFDPDCQGFASCEAVESICNDGFDNDGYGDIDCLDSDCDGINSCEYLIELTCDDGIDNDGDGSTDTNDGDCGGTGTTSSDQITVTVTSVSSGGEVTVDSLAQDESYDVEVIITPTADLVEHLLLVQVSDASGAVESLIYQSRGTVVVGENEELRFSFTAEQTDAYTIDVFVWDDWPSAGGTSLIDSLEVSS